MSWHPQSNLLRFLVLCFVPFEIAACCCLRPVGVGPYALAYSSMGLVIALYVAPIRLHFVYPRKYQYTTS